MTRHDRQFIGRLAVILFLLAGFAWQVYEGMYAATRAVRRLRARPPAAPGVAAAAPVPAGALRRRPDPRAQPVAAASAGVGRWSPFCAGAASVYNLATAITGTTTNLNLSYYILLGVLCPHPAPRAFSCRRMGWSRNHAAVRLTPDPLRSASALTAASQWPLSAAPDAPATLSLARSPDDEEVRDAQTDPSPSPSRRCSWRRSPSPGSGSPRAAARPTPRRRRLAVAARPGGGQAPAT